MIASILVTVGVCAQQVMSPELLWQLGRVSAVGITENGQSVVYNVKTYDAEANSASTKQYMVDIDGGEAIEIVNGESFQV